MLDKVLKRSDAVDKESLCILAGQRVSFLISDHYSTDFGQVWHLRLTLHFLADAGNMLDCACLAGMVALKHFRRPDVEVIGDEVTVVRLISFQHHGSSADQFLCSICLQSVHQFPYPSTTHLFVLRSRSSLILIHFLSLIRPNLNKG